ncbi:hypothetical protein [Mucilaginibacter sp.]
MKNSINWKAILFLIFLTTFSCLSKAQIYNGDSSKRLIVIVRPGNGYDNSGNAPSYTQNNSSTAQQPYTDPDVVRMPEEKTESPATSNSLGQNPNSPMSIRFISGDKHNSHLKDIGSDTSGMIITPSKKAIMYVDNIDPVNSKSLLHQTNQICFDISAESVLATSLNYNIIQFVSITIDGSYTIKQSIALTPAWLS